MSKANQPGLSRDRKAETEEPRSTLVAAPSDLPPFEEDMNFEEWLLTAKVNLPLYPRCQRIPLILRALLRDLFVAAVGACITHYTDVDQCCYTLAQLVIDREEETLARDFFQRSQKADEADEEYARNLQLLAERAFRGCPPNKIANWVAVQFKHVIRPFTLAEKLYEAKTNSLDQLVKLATKKRQELRGPPTFRKPQNLSNTAFSYRASPRYTPKPGKETWTVKFIVCPELAWDVILGADFLRYTKAILNFAEGTFSTHEATGVNTDTSLPKDDADDICNALFEAAAIPMNNLDDLCAQLTHISNYERKELRQLLLKYAKIFSWQGVRLGRTNIVKHKVDTGEARPIWQPPRRIPPPLLEEVNRLVEEMLRDEVIKPSKSPWASPIALVKKNDGSLRLCIDCRKLNAVTKKDAFPLPHINDSLDSLHGSQWFSTLGLKSGYWQMVVAEADREKTAFILPNGLYEFQTMPFGLCNAAATFQRLMQTALIDLFPKHCVIYLDDILVFGGDIQEHNANLKLVLDRLRDARLTLNPKKCHFLQRSVTFLGQQSGRME
ncbi:RNA directed DNA polymerase reverse transcriptase [Echinococcus multilocularis]|uniref:RNA directed DNA polymerase reverse transcriptase n=1 Tax=Echinococcus multilocularis TaxID=6211 RepID=A0A068YIM6_ECHMU|nr:RNA directed DNA polymerase reverse transcriptase [Echinococcus multilocularis]